MSYQILMDSCGDSSEKMKRSLHITQIALRIQIGKEEFLDDEFLDKKELLDKLKQAEQIPISSCPSPAQYVEACDPDSERIYILTGSSLLTGSYNSAKLAERMLKKENEKAGRQQEICVIDSKSASAGETLIAMKLLEWEEQNLSFETIKKKIHCLVRQMKTRFVLESLQMLELSGRLTGLKARLANALHICPVLSSTEEGAICQTGQARGTKKALMMLTRQILKDGRERKPKRIVISHCNCPEKAFALKAILMERLPETKIRIVSTNGISCMYAGEGGVIVAYE